MLRLTRHLSDDRLVALAIETAPGAAETAHLAGCDACAVRYARLAGLLRDVTAAAADDLDAAFPPVRLERQRARILQRVRQVAQPTPVLEFPASDRPAAPRPRVRRWMGAAASAAAGLLLGVLAGQTLLSDGQPEPAAAVAAPAPAPPGATARPAAITLSDDELLLQIEAAGRRPRPATLRSLDALTPRAADLVSLR